MADELTDEEALTKFRQMIHPLGKNGAFAKGWLVEAASRTGRDWTIILKHMKQPEPLVIHLVPAGSGEAYASTNYYDVRHANDYLAKWEFDCLRAVTRSLSINGF